MPELFENLSRKLKTKYVLIANEMTLDGLLGI
jgi:hypothetical protein